MKDCKLSEDAITTKSSAVSALPHLAIPYALIELPIRTNDRTLKALPMLTKSRTLRALPRRATPKMLMELPSRKKLLRLRTDPK
jgi:hypothetical protein